MGGFIVMWGLTPNSRHANHLHGNPVGDAAARCAPDARRTTRHVAELPEMVADGAPMVPGADPPIACGNLR